MQTCIECSKHKIVSDPDPTDWFCDDDVAVLCTKMNNTEGRRYWKYDVPFEHRAVTWSCRPHHIKKETEIPKWCPLLVKA